MQLIHTHIIDCNTFQFFVKLGTDSHSVKIIQISDFKGTILEEDFPNGSKSVWNTKASAHTCYTEIDCVNAVAPKLLAQWTRI